MAVEPAGNLTGIVLAGGLSTRMGRDKASLPWGQSDLLNTVLAALAPVCASLIVVSNIARTTVLPAVVVRDRYRGCGPLGGIQAGLAASGSDYNFVAACDMPYVDSRAVSYIAAAAVGYEAAVPFVGGYFHPLYAVYHRCCLPKIESLLQQGCYRITDLYPAVKTRVVSAAELAQFDGECGMLRNLNRPADLLDVNNYHE